MNIENLKQNIVTWLAQRAQLTAKIDELDKLVNRATAIAEGYEAGVKSAVEDEARRDRSEKGLRALHELEDKEVVEGVADGSQ